MSTQDAVDVDESVRRFVALERKRAALLKDRLDVQAQIEALNVRICDLTSRIRGVMIDVDMQKTTLEMLLAQEAGHPTVAAAVSDLPKQPLRYPHDAKDVPPGYVLNGDGWWYPHPAVKSDGT